jgi:putative two-component system response regulator
MLTVFKFRLEEKKVLARTKELLLTQDSTIESMATLAEYRDPETGGHIKRTREYIKILAEKMKEKLEYKDILTDSVIEMLYKSAPLHDIGKVGIPDNILLKPGDLTEEEFEIMKRHTLMGRNVIMAAETNLGRESFLKFAEEMAYTHQEKWDGSGYPRGLREEEIPISGRLMALVDVYDALISRRPYKKPYPHREAINSIKIASGKHFAPDVVGAFLELEKDFRDIAFKYADNDEEREILDQ